MTDTGPPIGTSHAKSRGVRTTPDTPLGAMIQARGVLVIDVVRATGIHPRTMTEYIAERKRPHVQHLISLCVYLDCDPDQILRVETPSHLRPT